MGTIFSEALIGWQNFYMLAGTSATSLIGLLFVAVSMHIDTIVSLQKTDAMRALADQTFRNLITILSFAFIFTIPNPTPQGTGILLLILGLLGFWASGLLGFWASGLLEDCMALDQVRPNIQDPYP